MPDCTPTGWCCGVPRASAPPSLLRAQRRRRIHARRCWAARNPEEPLAAQGVQFAYAAETVAHRAAELLAASVTVIDEHQTPVARAEAPGSTGPSARNREPSPELRLFVRLGGRSAEVIATGHKESI